MIISYSRFSKYAFPNFWVFLSFVISHSSESFALNLLYKRYFMEKIQQINLEIVNKLIFWLNYGVLWLQGVPWELLTHPWWSDLGQGTWIWPVGTPKVDIGSLQTTLRWFGNVTTKSLVKTGDFGVSLKKPTIMAHMSLQCQDMVRTCYRSKFGLGLPYISAFESQVLPWGKTEISGKRWFFTKMAISQLYGGALR